MDLLHTYYTFFEKWLGMTERNKKMIQTDDLEVIIRINTSGINIDTLNRYTGEELSHAKGTDLSFLLSVLSGRDTKYLLELISDKGFEKEILG